MLFKAFWNFFFYIKGLLHQLEEFPLFPMVEIILVYKHFGLRALVWNGLISQTKVPLYIIFYLFYFIIIFIYYFLFTYIPEFKFLYNIPNGAIFVLSNNL